MGRGNEIDKKIITEYCAKTGFAPNTARKHRANQTETWIAFCKESGYNHTRKPISYPKKKNKKMNKELEEIISDVELQPQQQDENINLCLVEKYKLLEMTAYNQLRKCQQLLDTSICEQDFQTLRAYVGAVKDLSSQFNELCRLRQIAEVQEGNYLPMSILDRYKTTFYPRLNSGIDEMKIAIENELPAEMVAYFQKAWNKAYYRYKDAAREAESAINDYKQLAANEALASIDKKENNKHKAKAAAKEKIKK